MGSILLINAAGRETRVALVEGGHIAEFYLERKKDKGVVGNIYKGRVVRVLPGMQAAFVDIGLDKAAFLYVSDVVYDPDFARAQFELTEGEHEDAPDVPEEEGAETEAAPAGPSTPDVHAELHAEVEDVEAHVEALHAAADAEHHGEEPPEALDEDDEEDGPAPDALHASGSDDAEGDPPAEAPGPDDARAMDAAGAAGAAATGSTPELEAEDAPGEPSAVAAIAAVESADADGAALAEAAEPGSAGLADAPVPTGVEPASATDAGHAETAPIDTAPDASPVRTNRGAPGNGQGGEARGERRAPRELRERHQGARDGNRDGGNRDRGDRGDRGGQRDKHKHAHGGRDEKPRSKKEVKIEDLLKVGQEVVVQISKDPIGSKGARLTSHISIPGRHLVFMPTVDHVGISRRISNEKERRRLRETVDRLRPPGTGFIVRTVAENVPQPKLESDIRFLIEIWNQVVRKNERRGGPGLMHPDLDLILRATRDLFAADVEKLVVDDREEYERILGFVTAQDPALAQRVVLHDSDEPIFDSYGIEQEIRRATQRKVWLKSGGYLIIDQAEALTAIDVNSGRYVGKKSLEETITKINMEAAKEIVYQLRLRNIGGIIICDFIDMEKSQNRDKVFKCLQEALGRDKAKTNVLRISELGLVEMTRKRVRESIGRMLHEDCGYCAGQGFVKTSTTVAYEIFREIRREAPNFMDPTLVVNCNVEVARLLQSEEREELRHLMDRYNKTIQVKPQTNYHREQYDLYGRTAHGEDHRVAASTSTLRAPEGAGQPLDRGGGEQPRGDQRHDRGERHRGGRNRRGGRDRNGGRSEGNGGGGHGGGGGNREGGRGENREPRDGRGDGNREGGREAREPREGRGEGHREGGRDARESREGRSEGPREPRGDGGGSGGGNRGDRPSSDKSSPSA